MATTMDQNDSRLKPQSIKPLCEKLKTFVVDFKQQTLDPDTISQQLSGKTFLITGGASGFGEAIASEVCRASQGARIIIADLDETKGENVARKLRSEGNNVQFFLVNVASWESQVALFARSLKWLQDSGGDGTIDHVICSAGVTSEPLDLEPTSPAGLLNGEVPPAPLTRCIRIHLEGSIYTTQLAMKYAMGLNKPSAPAKDKSITLLGSLSRYNAMPRRTDYSSSKWGLRGFFKSLVDETDGTSNSINSAASKVRVNHLAPFFVHTYLTQHRMDDLKKVGVHLADIKDVTKALLHLTSDPTLHGRSIGISANGIWDWKDDIAHGFGADVFTQQIETGALRIPRDISHSLIKPSNVS